MRAKDLKVLLYGYYRMLRKRMDSGYQEPRVLDIGSGHRPHIDATHLVDLYLEDDKERGKKLKCVGKILIQADIEALPFKAKVFDYVYASHVLEHTVDPALACRELIRVAKAGYIETPDPFYEQGYGYPNKERGWSFHRWFVWVGMDGALVFEKKTERALDEYCDCRYAGFVRKVYEKVPDLNVLQKALPRDCNNTCLEWKGDFPVRVVQASEESERAAVCES